MRPIHGGLGIVHDVGVGIQAGLAKREQRSAHVRGRSDEQRALFAQRIAHPGIEARGVFSCGGGKFLQDDVATFHAHAHHVGSHLARTAMPGRTAIHHEARVGRYHHLPDLPFLIELHGLRESRRFVVEHDAVVGGVPVAEASEHDAVVIVLAALNASGVALAPPFHCCHIGGTRGEHRRSDAKHGDQRPF